MSVFEPVIAARPVIQLDHQFANLNVIHVASRRKTQRRPVLIVMKKNVRVYSADGENDKVYMTLTEYPKEVYFFTCVNQEEAKILSDHLSQ